MKSLNCQVEEDLLQPRLDSMRKLVSNEECEEGHTTPEEVDEEKRTNSSSEMHNETFDPKNPKEMKEDLVCNSSVIEDLVLSHKLNKAFLKKLLRSSQNKIEANNNKAKRDRHKKSVTAVHGGPKVHKPRHSPRPLILPPISPTNSKLNLALCTNQLLEKIKEESEFSDCEKAEETKSKMTPNTVRWIGVNGHEHDHSAAESADGTPHYHVMGSPNTPHIIVSPDVDNQDTPPEFPPVDEEANVDKDSKAEPSDKASSSPLEIVEATEPLPPATSEETADEDICTEVLVQKDDMKTETKLEETHSLKGIQKTRKVSPPQSPDTPPGEAQPQPFYPNLENCVEDGQPPEYQPRSTVIPHSKYDNNPFRSMSMSNLEPLDPFMRKTRRNSMIGMMRRVSSASNIGLHGLVPGSVARSTSRISLVPPTDWRLEMNESLILCISALYGKLLVVLGMAFPMAEAISKDVPRIFYNSFYLYLYFGSILFLVYAYLFLLRAKSFVTGILRHKITKLKKRASNMSINWSNVPLPERFCHYMMRRRQQKSERDERMSVNTSTYKAPKYTITESSNHGSMYLKMGAVIFGIGSMIYSGLEFGQYFELSSASGCANILMAITPVARMIFTFLQMYFIFLNSRVAISKHTIIARFGLMHMVGTNLCIWLNVLVQETKHEINHLTEKESHRSVTSTPLLGNHHKASSLNSILGDDHEESDSHEINSGESNFEHLLKMDKRSAPFLEEDNCRSINLMGHVVSSASPFLFPCTIEYSLLCAGVLYVMWKNINVNRSEKSNDGDSDVSTFIARKIRHHYSVDCARASRGLFMGIFVLVLTIISLILFYVLISNEQFTEFAILEANIVELSIYSMAIFSVIYGMKQMRELEFIPDGEIELDNILLIIAQAGVYIYTSFTIIGGYFNLQENQKLQLLTAVITLIQTTLQTLFILDGSRRCCYTPDQLDRKPGRETVTFLLVCNLAMWAISTFETSRADVHPVQLHFYGIWAWTIISHVSMPLAIFYRFHVTVCLGEIWKRSYKMKNEYVGL